MTEIGKALQLALWLALFAYLASIGAQSWTYAIAVVGLLVWMVARD